MGKAAGGGEATEAWGQDSGSEPSAWTQRQPGEMETVLCVESDFWDKRNQMKNDECLVAAMKEEKKEE